MARFDRYMLAQCLQLFGFFALVLVLVFWVNQAVSLFDRLIADGQTALVFLEFTALTLPNIIRTILPIAAFAAVLYVTNRMSSESELTVMQATGYSAKRMARPIVYFGIVAGLMMTVLMHVLVPISQERLALRTQEVSANVTSRLLREGVFTHPGTGSTLYLRDITENGELLDVFLADLEPGESDEIFTAERAFLVKTEDGPRLVMIDGQSQILDPESQNLFVTVFSDFVIDIGSLVDEDTVRQPRLRELLTPRLMSADQALLDLTGKTRGDIAEEFHSRIAQSIFPMVAALVGFAVLMSAGFTRLGIWKQIIAALGVLVVLVSLENVMAERIITNPANWPLAYVPALVGLVVAWVGLTWADRNRRMPASGAAT
ncbi:MAG: LPS export ABC transporter permease LptF [Pseudomonadota bacterium]